MNNSSLRNIVITGPESTGKTSLSLKLAEKFQGIVVPEYARTYVETHGTQYTYSDVEEIAKHQWNEYLKYSNNTDKMVFYDTFLIVTKVWFTWCYDKVPGWLTDCMQKTKIDLYLVCNTDLPWVPDDIRENGGENRELLLKLYLEEINKINVPYKVINGEGDQRFNNAVNIIQSFFY